MLKSKCCWHEDLLLIDILMTTCEWKIFFFRVSLHVPATRDLRVTNACTVGDSGLFAWYFEKLSSLNIVLAQLKDLFP